MTLGAEAAVLVPEDPSKAVEIFKEILHAISRVGDCRFKSGRPSQHSVTKWVPNKWWAGRKGSKMLKSTALAGEAGPGAGKLIVSAMIAKGAHLGEMMIRPHRWLLPKGRFCPSLSRTFAMGVMGSKCGFPGWCAKSPSFRSRAGRTLPAYRREYPAACRDPAGPRTCGDVR